MKVKRDDAHLGEPEHEQVLHVPAALQLVVEERQQPFGLHARLFHAPALHTRAHRGRRLQQKLKMISVISVGFHLNCRVLKTRYGVLLNAMGREMVEAHLRGARVRRLVASAQRVQQLLGHHLPQQVATPQQHHPHLARVNTHTWLG